MPDRFPEPDLDQAWSDEIDERLVKVGVYCLRGGGHWACYDEEDAAACGTKGPDVFLAVCMEDYAMYPEWLQRVVSDQWAFAASNQDSRQS